MSEIIVNLDNRSYPIIIEPGIFSETGQLLQQHQQTGDLFVITDSNVLPLYVDALQISLQNAGLSAKILTVPAGENSKSLERANELYTSLIQQGATRKSIIIALGGGVVGDLAGFVAATFLRGIRFVQIPTTLLSQVDSSVGGKVGINHALGKNLIGAFHQPELVIIDPVVLRTLPTREIKAGLAEVLKYSFILDYPFFDQLSCTVQFLISLNDMPLLQDVIARCCQLKADVVAQDEREGGLRAILNFGHTIGHALETITDYHYFLHGEAVSHGMRSALYLSYLKKFINRHYLEQTCSLIDILQPPPIPKHITAAEIVQAMGKDKKRSDKGQLWILLESIGKYTMTRDVTDADVNLAIDFVLSGKQ